MMWLDERVNRSVRSPVFAICYVKEKVIISFFQELPPPLDILLIRRDLCSRSFHQNIRMYNSALSFTSIGIKIDHQITDTNGVYFFHIHGEIYYRIGTLLPDPET